MGSDYSSDGILSPDRFGVRSSRGRFGDSPPRNYLCSGISCLWKALRQIRLGNPFNSRFDNNNLRPAHFVAVQWRNKYLQIAVGLSILGVGNGMFTSPNSSAIMGSVPADRRGIASAFWNMMFQIGLTASYGLAVLMIASVVPYNAFSTLLQGSIASSVASIARNEFFNGFRLVTLIFVAIDLAAIGIVFAGSRARIIRY